ncbi:MAG: hypothetical protein COB79_05995 [Zetaproteobacteria bacterium]|nr:MAG: hypothetical protein COB79_05995 [Zetaproteobacteria bacterium]
MIQMSNVYTLATCPVFGYHFRLFELRVKGKDGIARVFYCTKVGKHIVMLHVFVKKTQKTPKKELKIATQRMREVKNNES